jgi:hypothetical protein
MRHVLIGIPFVAVIALSSALAQDTATPSPAPAAAPAAAAAPAPTPVPLAPAAAAPMVESIKIIIDDKAKTDGEIRFNFTPAGGTPVAIRVTVAKKMNNKEVAQDLAKELTVALGPDFKVDRYDPDKIKISAKKKDAKFQLTLAALTANGLSVRLK